MTRYEKMKSIIDEIDSLIEKKVTRSNPEFKAWHSKAERFLIKTFGDNSLEHKSFLPDPPPLMTARTYKTKFIEPLFNKLIGLVKGLAKQCMELQSRVFGMKVGAGLDKRKVNELYKDNDYLREENQELVGDVLKFRLLRKVFGDEEVGEIKGSIFCKNISIYSGKKIKEGFIFSLSTRNKKFARPGDDYSENLCKEILNFAVTFIEPEIATYCLNEHILEGK